ncbi:hypothetical protein HYQ09_gp059 [Acinetobacter phage vB_AbaM_Konradin]|uniref:Uncharacterized protein n=2 Tax=Lazarusvirus TaxID=2842820 RepID=A0A650EV08_9CAUD|nr:hypothetical protein HYP70_gp220 [Acinetobacter phage KARL-1]YP_009885243.1 hypothetical protein HYQ09_gp059 [Acinetobacter phage vB_AbaM_Konradin]AXY82839.1 hypothetical protein KARL1_220 [Acinetobacter phage KARL-1]QGT53823.1 hypothetical protein Konradin_060 [Acinetobacter phage vB_AbaM_Konradin]
MKEFFKRDEYGNIGPDWFRWIVIIAAFSMARFNHVIKVSKLNELV